MLRIRTWNVQTMYQAGKSRYNIIKEMRAVNIDILGISEVRQTGSRKAEYDDSVFVYSAGTKLNGVGIMIRKQIGKSMSGFIPISDRAD